MRSPTPPIAVRLAALAGALLAACGATPREEDLPPAPGAEAPPAAPADAGPPDPLARPTDAPLVLRFSYSLSEELSCTRSFESDGWSARYELAVEPSGAATMSLRGDRSHAFGASSGRFEPGRADDSTREQRGEDRTWRGRAEWRGEALALELEPEQAECKRLVQGKGWYRVDCAPSAALSLSCARGVVQAASGDVEVLSCAPSFGLPGAGEVEVALPESLPFAPAPGLELEYWRHGIGAVDPPKLRALPPDSAGELSLP